MTAPTPKHQPWTMPEWMEPYRWIFNNTGGNSIEFLMERWHSGERLFFTNLPVGIMACSVAAQVQLLAALREAGALPAPDAAQGLHDLLRRAMNGRENESNSPDFLLASMLSKVLETVEEFTHERDHWWGNRSLSGPASTAGIQGDPPPCSVCIDRETEGQVPG